MKTTGAGMMDAKKALVESDGDMDAAVDWLRKRRACRRRPRSPDARLLTGSSPRPSFADGKTGAVVELNAETDFVARNAHPSSLR